jgi:hypothetical protein
MRSAQARRAVVEELLSTEACRPRYRAKVSPPRLSCRSGLYAFPTRLQPPPLRACDPCPRAVRRPSAPRGNKRRGFHTQRLARASAAEARALRYITQSATFCARESLIRSAIVGGSCGHLRRATPRMRGAAILTASKASAACLSADTQTSSTNSTASSSGSLWPSLWCGSFGKPSPTSSTRRRSRSVPSRAAGASAAQPP